MNLEPYVGVLDFPHGTPRLRDEVWGGCRLSDALTTKGKEVGESVSPVPEDSAHRGERDGPIEFRSRGAVIPDSRHLFVASEPANHVRLDAAEINTWLRDAENKDQADAEQSLVKATRAGCEVPARPQ